MKMKMKDKEIVIFCLILKSMRFIYRSISKTKPFEYKNLYFILRSVVQKILFDQMRMFTSKNMKKLLNVFQNFHI